MPSLSVVIDCADPEKLASFWAPALGYVSIPAEPYVVLVAPDDDRPRVLLQRVDEPKTGKNRVHIDLHTDDIEAEAARLEELGATRTDAYTEHGICWIVMRDPDGNEFCVCNS